MSVIGSNALAGASGQGGGYNLTKSLRFRSSASAYLNRTPASASNRRTFTINFWLKRGELGTLDQLIGQGNGIGGGAFAIYFDSDGLRVYGGSNDILITNAKFRDPASWYMITLAMDTTQATASNRAKLYINGVEQTYSSTNYPTINTDLPFNQAVQHTISGNTSQSYLFDGYLAEFNFIDGQALTPSSFGETSTTTGVWIPKKYTGTYGTNGFYLKFTDTASTSTLGTDFSGNSNTWTVNNISLTSGSTYDSMTDVPTLTNATTANYCVINGTTSQPTGWGAATTFSNANLTGTMPNAGTDAPAYGTIALPRSGKWYWEVTISSSTVPGAVGIAESSMKRPDGTGPLARQLYSGGGTGVSKAYDGTNLTGSYTFFGNATLGVACDMDNGKLFISVNGTYVNSGDPVAGTGAIFTDLLSTSPGGGSWLPMSFGYNGHVHNHNYGQQPFTYTAPAGFVALNTFNLPTPTIGATASELANEYFDATTYTGTGSSQLISNSGSFQPNFVWIKERSAAGQHNLMDVLRTGLRLRTDDTAADSASSTLFSFASTGFNVLTNNASYNGSAKTYVAWQWKASDSGVSNTAGSITSTVSASTTAGFSIVTWTGNGTGGATVGHGLGVAPSMVIVKRRSAASDWPVSSRSINAGQILVLNNTNAVSTDNGPFASTYPSSTVITLGTSTDTNANTATYVAYCFAPVAGYSAFGSYTGNGSSDGTFVFTGFRPRYVMIKRSNTTGDWIVYDSARSTYNGITSEIYPNLSNAEDNSSVDLDFVSNGIKLRNSGSGVNASGDTYIYMAFAENPFKYANAR